MSLLNFGAGKKAKIVSATLLIAVLAGHPVAVLAAIDCGAAFFNCKSKWYIPDAGCQVLYEDCAAK